MSSEDQNTEAGVVAEIVKEHIKPHVLTIERPNESKVPLLVLPEGLSTYSIKEFLDEYRTAPERRRGTASFTDLASFIAHTKRFADKDSALFAMDNTINPSLTAVLNYHLATAAGAPRFGDHRGEYRFPVSDEWQAWQAKNAKPMSQSDFAEFVETRIVDIADPGGAGESAKKLADSIGATFGSPSKLLELSRGLSLRVGAKLQSAVNLATGEAQMQFVTQHADENGAPIKVPTAFLVALPVFRNGAAYQLAARLRYRVRDGAVTWFYELHRADRAFDDAFREACKEAEKDTGLPLFFGSPE
jgi:uncharacterized protein YfdQ (DUF2303 family)